MARRTLREFWERYPDAEESLKAWHADVRRATWSSPSDIRRVYSNASFVGNNRVVFNIRGNRYRLIVIVKYESELVFIRFVGTHREYDHIDARVI